MALPVLDGNQTATTLSSVVTGGEHIVAHSVVSLGANAIANITSAVSGSVVSISNFPPTQTIAGTVTANVLAVDQNALQSALDQYAANYTDGWPVKYSDGNNFPISGTVTANAGGDFANSIESVFDVGNVSKKIAVQLYDDNGGAVGVPNNPLPISGTVTVGGFSSVSVGSGAILIAGDRGGTITPIPIDSGSGQVGVQLKQSSGPSIDPISQTNGLWVRQANGSSITVGNSVTIGSLPAISGTVTVGNNNFNIKTVIAQDGSANFTVSNGTQFRLYTPTGASKTLNNIFGATPSWVVAYSDSITWVSESGTQVAYFHDGTQWTLDDFTTPAGTLALDGSVFVTNLSYESNINILNGFTAAQLGTAYINGSGALRVSVYSGTVTAAAPNGSLTTRFGTPTTANTAFATSAVTNANRKYLLIQNVTTGSNVITVGIGFTPTTTQGIQLTAGAGITFESSYIPTGAVQILSSVTASNFTILEA